MCSLPPMCTCKKQWARLAVEVLMIWSAKPENNEARATKSKNVFLQQWLRNKQNSWIKWLTRTQIALLLDRKGPWRVVKTKLVENASVIDEDVQLIYCVCWLNRKESKLKMSNWIVQGRCQICLFKRWVLLRKMSNCIVVFIWMVKRRQDCSRWSS